MPASVGSGLLFELCPDQLPAGFVLPGEGHSHQHHHQSPDDNAPTEPDSCQIGHILSSAAAPGDLDSDEADTLQPAFVVSAPATLAHFARRLAFRSRGPPA